MREIPREVLAALLEDAHWAPTHGLTQPWRFHLFAKPKALAQLADGLQGRSVRAVDGHQVEHACHALRDTKDRRVPPGSLYALNLRQGSLSGPAEFTSNSMDRSPVPPQALALLRPAYSKTTLRHRPRIKAANTDALSPSASRPPRGSLRWCPRAPTSILGRW